MLVGPSHVERPGELAGDRVEGADHARGVVRVVIVGDGAAFCTVLRTLKRLLAVGLPVGLSMRIRLLDEEPVSAARRSKPIVALM